MIARAMSKQAQSTYSILEKNELSYLKKKSIARDTTETLYVNL